MIARLTIEAHGHDVKVRGNIRDLDPCVQPAVLNALTVHLGFEPRPLMKAVVDPVVVDPRYPWLASLIRAARRDWDVHGADLVHRLETMLTRGKLLPLTAANERVLHTLFRDHQIGLLLRFAGSAPNVDKATVRRLVAKGVIHADYEQTALVSMSYRLGRGLDALSVHAALEPMDLTEATRRAAQVQLTAADRTAMAYARRRAATYMRRPAEAQRTEMERVLTEAERWSIGETVARDVAQHRSTSQVAQDLKTAVAGTMLSNDMDRVARTELHFAHAHGAYVGLKEQAGRSGVDDPQVYKIIRPGACEHCARIWGPPGAPHTYHLSFIEAREGAGANFRLPADQWGPVIGPVHPNCTEGALLYYEPALFEATQDALDWLRDTFDD